MHLVHCIAIAVIFRTLITSWPRGRWLLISIWMYWDPEPGGSLLCLSILALLFSFQFFWLKFLINTVDKNSSLKLDTGHRHRGPSCQETFKSWIFPTSRGGDQKLQNSNFFKDLFKIHFTLFWVILDKLTLMTFGGVTPYSSNCVGVPRGKKQFFSPKCPKNGLVSEIICPTFW